MLWRGVHRGGVRSGPAEVRGGKAEGQSSQEGEEKIVVSGEYVAVGGGGYIVRLPEQH